MGSPVVSPVNGQPTPPPGYKLDVTPPAGYVLDQAKAASQSPPVHPVLKQVLDENPGFAKVYNADNTSVVFATGDRARRGAKERGGLEFWPSTEEGTEDYPHPAPGKNVLEVYTDELKNKPEVLKNAIAGDLTHGMAQDPYWKNLRDEFMQSFTPVDLKRQEQGKTYFEDTNDPKRERETRTMMPTSWGGSTTMGNKGKKSPGEQCTLRSKSNSYSRCKTI